MAGRSVEEAWNWNISGEATAVRCPPLKEGHLWHANMPNISIAFMISQFRCAVHVKVCRDAQVPTIGVLEIGVPGMTDDPSASAVAASARERKPLTPAARRALAEAEARRQAAEANAQPVARELQGPKGPESTRYGDWENKGIASDF
jgi:hypothetical protein